MAIATKRGFPVRDEDNDEFYITSDGKPMAETARHVQRIVDCISALQAFFATRPDVLVAGNNFLHYEQGNRSAHVSPDTYVVFGVDNAKEPRDSYKAWEEGK